MTDAIVEVQQGRLRGLVADGIAAFKGVPYAASPAGEKRWLPPGPVEPWAGVRDATDFGPSCPQPADRPPGWAHESLEDEDCLVLNLWTLAAGDGGRRPVMVWFHGGLYSIGSGSWPVYDGAALARRGDVVVVTVNHRLGPLGYLHLADIGGTAYASSGNAGMLDLVASLEWVRDNIGAFGGDPSNVTIFGESGGGAKVSTLLAMPTARGLFHRAAIQSGPGLRAQEPEEAADRAARLLSELGVAPREGALAALHAMPAERLVAAQQAIFPRPSAAGAGAPGGAGGRMPGLGPVRDGSILPSHPYAALADGTAADVPVLIGRNRDEATMFMAADPVLAHPDELDEAGLRRRLSGLGPKAEELLAGYRKARPEATPLDLLIAIRTDAFMGRGTVVFAEQKLKGGPTPVFMYLFCWASGLLRAAHGYEIAFVFDNARPPVMRPSESRTELAARMSEAWIAFARGGDPNHAGLPKWPAYSLDERATMVFDRGECKVENDPSAVERRIWESV